MQFRNFQCLFIYLFIIYPNVGLAHMSTGKEGKEKRLSVPLCPLDPAPNQTKFSARCILLLLVIRIASSTITLSTSCPFV